MSSHYTPAQRVARGFHVLDRSDRSQPWRGINRTRLSFTDDGWDVLAQIFSTTVEGMGKLCLTPAEAIDHGFIALSNEDADELRKFWVLNLTPEDDT